MVRSMIAGVAGLKTHQSKLDVIGNNIANVNTWGFKSSSFNFADSMYSTSINGSAGNDLAGRIWSYNRIDLYIVSGRRSGAVRKFSRLYDRWNRIFPCRKYDQRKLYQRGRVRTESFQNRFVLCGWKWVSGRLHGKLCIWIFTG